MKVTVNSAILYSYDSSYLTFDIACVAAGPVTQDPAFRLSATQATFWTCYWSMSHMVVNKVILAPQWSRQNQHLIGCINYSALINRAGGLYGRILTEVASTEWTQWGLYQWPRSRFSHTDRPCVVNKMFIIWPNKKAKEQKHQFRIHLRL